MATIGGIIFCLVIAGLDIAAGFLGIQAEISQTQEKHVKGQLECREPSQVAYRLGLSAVTILVILHAVIILAGGCACVCSQDECEKSSSNKKISMVCLVLTWIVFAIGFVALMIGAMSNSNSRSSCGLTNYHFLSIGGIFCFLHALFCAAYYVSTNAAKDEAATVNEEEPKQSLFC